MKTKDNIVGIRLDDTTLALLDSLSEELGTKTRSSTLRRLLLYVDRECGGLGVHANFKRWSKRLDSRPLFG